MFQMRQRRSIEQLENRMMLAGNVTASVVNGDLVLTGDASSNRIEVEQISATEWEVDGYGTTVNGTDAAVIAAVTGSVLANLGAGHDSIKFEGDVAANLNIVTDSGNDRVSVYDSTVVGNLTVNTGDGHDLAYLRNIDVTGALDVDTGIGSDLLHLSVMTAAGATFDTGDGHDSLRMARIDFGASVAVTTGAGTDLVSLDRLTVEGDLDLDLGASNHDKLLALRADVTGDVDLAGGEGDHDKVVQAGLTAGGTVSLDGFEVDKVLENLGLGRFGRALGRFV